MTSVLWIAVLIGLQEAPPESPQSEGLIRRLGPTRFRHNEKVHSAALSPDGRYLATGDSKVVRIWEAATGKELHHLKFPGRALSFSQDGARLAAAGVEIVVVDCATGESVQTLIGHWGPVLSVAFSPDGTHLASASDDTTVRVWGLKDGNEKRRFEDHLNSVFSIAWSPDGSTLAGGSRDDTVRIWSMKADTPARVLIGHGDDVRSVVFTRDGTRLISAGGDNTLAVGEEDCAIRIWDLRRGGAPMRLEGHKKTVQSLVLSKDGTLLLSGDLGGEVRAWELPTGRMVRSFKAGSGLRSLALMPDARHLAVVAGGQAPKFWSVGTGEAAGEEDGHLGAVQFLGVLPDGSRLIAGDAAGEILVWNLARGNVERRWMAHAGGVNRIVVTRDGRRAASVGRDKTMRVWNLEDGSELARADMDYEWSLGLDWWPDDETVAFQPIRSELHLYSMKEKRAIRSYAGVGKRFTPVFLGDGRSAALAESNATVRLWDFEACAGHNVYSGLRQVHYLSVSPDGRRLGIGAEAFAILDLESGATSDLTKEYPAMGRLVFSSDGRRVLCAPWNKPMLTVVDVASGQGGVGYTADMGRMKAYAFLPDGWTAVAGLSDTTIGFWSFAPDDTAAKVKDLDALWKDLADGSLDEAWASIGVLAGKGEPAVAFIKGRLRPAEDAKVIDRLLADLRGDGVEAQKKAAEALVEMGGLAEPDLESAVKAEPDEEIRKRLNAVLDSYRGPMVKSRAILRRLRAMEVLERIGSKEAIDLLRDLSTTAVSRRERTEAAWILKRLKK